MERRLSEILIADVVGYTRLSQLDEEGTRRRFLADLEEIFGPKIAEHHGRQVKTMNQLLKLRNQQNHPRFQLNRHTLCCS